MRLAALVHLSALAPGLIALPEHLLAQTVPPSAIHCTPERPTQGSLVRIEIEVLFPDGNPPSIQGLLAGEPLHFQPDAPGRLMALGGIPIDTGDSLLLTLIVGESDTIRSILAVSRGEFSSERLKVAPEFGRPPDSATARRIADENALARSIGRKAHATPRFWHPPFVPPRPSRITGTYGHGRIYNGRLESRHFGTDFAGAVGDPVVATNAGVVRLVTDFYLAGKVVYVDHGAGLVSGYFHLSRADVAAGDTVSAGQVIGAVGQSGRVTGSHLHWTVRYGAITVNPQSLLELEGK